MLKETICYEPLYSSQKRKRLIDLQRARRNKNKKHE